MKKATCIVLHLLVFIRDKIINYIYRCIYKRKCIDSEITNTDNSDGIQNKFMHAIFCNSTETWSYKLLITSNGKYSVGFFLECGLIMKRLIWPNDLDTQTSTLGLSGLTQVTIEMTLWVDSHPQWISCYWLSASSLLFTHCLYNDLVDIYWSEHLFWG